MPKKIPPGSGGFNPFGDLIGLNFVRCEDGHSQCVLEVDERLLNPHRVLHGGVIYSMADTGMGGALYSCMEDDELCATIEIQIIYLKAVASGRLTCDTRILHRSKRIASLESEIANNGRLVAKATGTFSIFRVK
jgi:acyl-CoA thioesterase